MVVMSNNSNPFRWAVKPDGDVMDRECKNCKYAELSVNREPCCFCDRYGTHNKWQPKEEKEVDKKESEDKGCDGCKYILPILNEHCFGCYQASLSSGKKYTKWQPQEAEPVKEKKVEKYCMNCKFANKTREEEPCNHCVISDHTEWQPCDHCDILDHNHWQPKDPSTFWMVYGEGRQAPTRKHQTREEAVNEAQRLAKLNVGTAFYVLAAWLRVAADEPVVKVEALCSTQS